MTPSVERYFVAELLTCNFPTANEFSLASNQGEKKVYDLEIPVHRYTTTQLSESAVQH